VSKSFVQPRTLRQALRHPFTRLRIEALRHLDLTVTEGTATGLLGPNGAGKTTLLRVLSAALLPDRGEVRILGLDIARNGREIRRRVGVVLSEERSFFWRISARENLRFFSVLCELESERARRRIEELVEMLDLGQFIDRPFRLLSTGMRQRLTLARALLHDPQVLLVDEPTRALDPGAAEKIIRLLREQVVGKMKKTLLVATHQLHEVGELCDRLAFMKNGRIEQEGRTAELLPQAREFFGTLE